MNINFLEKILKYRLSYSGTKETDILYKKLILGKLNNFQNEELNLLISLFNEHSDDDIFSFFLKEIKNILNQLVFLQFH